MIEMNIMTSDHPDVEGEVDFVHMNNMEGEVMGELKLQLGK